MKRAARQRWTPREDAKLIKLWGHQSTLAISEAVGRTPYAVELRGRALGLGGHRHGLVTIRQLIERSGYSRETVMLALKTLKVQVIPVPRVSARKAATQTQHRGIWASKVAAVMGYLTGRTVGSITPRPGLRLGPAGVWGIVGRPACCNGCGTADRPHYAKGMCERCYTRALRARLKLAG